MGIPSIRELTRRRESPGAVVVRRGLPVTIGLPLVTGAIVLVFLEEGWPATTMLATLLVGTMATATAMLLWTAASVDEPYRRRSEAEAALRRSQEQHRALARSFPDGAVVLFDRKLRHLIADGVGLTAVGLSAEAMEGKTIWEVFPPDVCVTIEPFYRAALDGAESQFEHTFRDRTYAVRVVPVSDEATQEVWGGAVTVADITERKRSDRELGEATERFARIFENAPIGEAIATPEGRFLQVNRALCEALGYSERELLLLGFLDITHPDDRETSAAAAREAVDGVVRSYELEKRYVHAQGHVVRARIRASLVRDDADRPAYFVIQIEDVTERL
jgi:PAS domain S-box-containing protein